MLMVGVYALSLSLLAGNMVSLQNSKGVTVIE
jgi:hypothetical protein